MRKPVCERLGRWCLPASLIGGVVVLAVVFWLALAAVALIPSDLVGDNLAEAREIVAEEGDHPVSYATGAYYDNFTVGVMLDQVGAMDEGEPPLAAALVPGYARYWHGYLTLLRPLLAVWGIYRIRFACQGVFAVVTVVAAALLCLRLGRRGAAVACALVAAEALVGAFDAVSCLPLFPSFALSVAGVAWVMAPVRVDARDARVTRAGFFLIGALAVYFDFLDNPVLTLGMPLTALAVRSCLEGRDPRNPRNLRGCVVLVASCCAMWLCGYGLLWGSKWVLATLVGGADVVADALATAQFRVGVGEQAGAFDTSPLAAIRMNVAALGWPAYLLALGLAALCAMAVFALATGGRERRVLVGQTAVLVAIAAIPYVWYAVLSNHSAVHFDIIAFRNQALAFFALGSAVVVAAGGLRDARAGRRSAEENNV